MLSSVLCAYDASAAAERALAAAADLAARTGAVLHVVYDAPAGPGLRTTDPLASADAVEARARATVRGVPALTPTLHTTHARRPADGILEVAGALGADLVVMGTHGRRGLGRLLLGSVAAEVLRRARVPVLVLHAEGHDEAPRPPVLVATDLGDAAPALVGLGRDLAAAYDTDVVLAHVREVPPERLVDTEPHRPLAPHAAPLGRAEAHRALTALAAEAGLDDTGRAAEQHVLPGHAADEIAALARRLGAGLVVVGSHGRRGWERVRLGSVAEQVVRTAPCPVLVVPSRALDGGQEADAPADRTDRADR